MLILEAAIGIEPMNKAFAVFQSHFGFVWLCSFQADYHWKMARDTFFQITLESAESA